ncbi:MBL fold metallo-hydrolase [Candidatus Gottesmanbacteria bacterium]|nr:MBL fold metallo-hydrolase [Candidatus Gottesmanbacteria bacterium]
MKVHKIGHCCLVIDVDGLRILTDPGAYTDKQNQIQKIDVIAITHEHLDHLHIESLKKVLVKNPRSTIITNNAVGKILLQKNIKYDLLGHNKKKKFKNVLIEGFGKLHADIYSTVPRVENTGYFIANKLFYPGDALTDPGKKVEILALPVAGPWLTLGQAIDYSKRIKPKKCFPVHDGMLKFLGPVHFLPEKVLGDFGSKFIPLEAGESTQF